MQVTISAKRERLLRLADELRLAADAERVNLTIYAQDEDADELTLAFDNDDMEDSMRPSADRYPDGLVIVMVDFDG